MLVNRLYQHAFLGDAFLLLRGDGKMLQRIEHAEKKPDEAYSDNVYDDAVQQLNAYFEGSRKTFDVKIFQEGTDLQQQHWQHLRKIPYGNTITYSELAAQSSSKNAVRAAASACANNPLPIIVPCHRVVGKDGSLRGFAWGLEMKEKLLHLERSHQNL